jgi:hypothetical protein
LNRDAAALNLGHDRRDAADAPLRSAVAVDCAVYARSWAASHDPYLAYTSELTFDVAH